MAAVFQLHVLEPGQQTGGNGTVQQQQTVVIARYFRKGTVVGDLPLQIPDQVRKLFLRRQFRFPGLQKVFGLVHGRSVRFAEAHQGVGAETPPLVEGGPQAGDVLRHAQLVEIPEFFAGLAFDFFLLAGAEQFFDALHEFRFCGSRQFGRKDFPAELFQHGQPLVSGRQLFERLLDFLKTGTFGGGQIVVPPPGIGQFFHDLPEQIDPFLTAAVPGDPPVVLQEGMEMFVPAGKRRIEAVQQRGIRALRGIQSVFPADGAEFFPAGEEQQFSLFRQGRGEGIAERPGLFQGLIRDQCAAFFQIGVESGAELQQLPVEPAEFGRIGKIAALYQTFDIFNGRAKLSHGLSSSSFRS